MKKRDGKKFNIKEEFKESFRFVRESKNYVYLILGLFIISTLIAVIIPIPQSIQIQIQEYIRELLKKTIDMNFFEMFQFIFLNNLKSSFVGMVSGIFLGIPSLIITFVNEFFLGFVAMLSVNSEGIFVLWRIFPHGIFELPAVFISLGLGVKIGVSFFEKKKGSIRNTFLKSIKVFIFIIVPLLFIAAIIESILICFVS